jgi:hypothetical protein
LVPFHKREVAAPGQIVEQAVTTVRPETKGTLVDPTTLQLTKYIFPHRGRNLDLHQTSGRRPIPHDVSKILFQISKNRMREPGKDSLLSLLTG